MKKKLIEFSHARSGDKGNHANIGVLANDDDAYRLLDQYLTAEKVAEYFKVLNPSSVQRFPLPGIKAFNFLMKDVLAGGGSGSLRIDSQGKTLASMLLEMELDLDPESC